VLRAVSSWSLPFPAGDCFQRVRWGTLSNDWCCARRGYGASPQAEQSSGLARLRCWANGSVLCKPFVRAFYVNLVLMAGATCIRCRARHLPDQLCLAQAFEIRLGLKEDDRSFGCLVVSNVTEDADVFSQMKKQYAIRVSPWTRYTRFSVLSQKLFVVRRLLEFPPL
jgi:hypothetical protein